MQFRISSSLLTASVEMTFDDLRLPSGPLKETY